jgi:formamidopyrimidine-DNA glycosylase
VPELPEVEYTRRQLSRTMRGRRVDRVLARRPDLRYPLGSDFVARLDGQTVREVRRRAKYLLVDLSSGDTLVIHLGMSGSFRTIRSGPPDHLRQGYDGPPKLYAKAEGGPYKKKEEPWLPHDHVVFEMSSGVAVVFNDPRRFGFMRLVAAGAVDSDRSVGTLGPEPLDRAFTSDVLAAALRRRKTSLKAALSDQRLVAGLGNIYIVEALHRARLSPKRRASTLVTRSGAPRPQVGALVDAIKDVLRDAIANAHRPYGEDRFRVYDKEGRPCPRRGCPGIIKRIVQGGRSTFFCPVCQK